MITNGKTNFDSACGPSQKIDSCHDKTSDVEAVPVVLDLPIKQTEIKD
jgi:hypothetical protein